MMWVHSSGELSSINSVAGAITLFNGFFTFLYFVYFFNIYVYTFKNIHIPVVKVKGKSKKRIFFCLLKKIRK